jgi:hypothetical protein
VQEQFETPQEYRNFVEESIPDEIERNLEKYMFD